jgi:hypothetical protein
MSKHTIVEFLVAHRKTSLSLTEIEDAHRQLLLNNYTPHVQGIWKMHLFGFSTKTPYNGSKVNFCPPTLTSNIMPPLVCVNTATPSSKSAFFEAPFLMTTAVA